MSAAIIAGISASLKVVSAGSRRNSAITQNASKYGTDLASQEYQRNQVSSAGSENAKIAQANSGATQTSITLDSNNTRAQQESAVALSGSTGGSSEQVQSQSERNTAISAEQESQRLETELQQIERQTSDALVGVETSVGDEPDVRRTNDLLLGGLAGLGTYGSLGGFT